jgi:1-deoxy-D-xylulose-5-phosphate synthase
MARARDLKNGRHEIISVIGDGAMTSGLALEGLNNAHGVKRFIVILNDNEMSISRTTGAFARHFSKLVSSPRYRKIKHSVGSILPRIWLVGSFLTKLILRIQGGIKHILAPQNIFENLGFHYLGPLNGHDVTELVKFLQACKEETETPILLHLITKKGKGFEPAEFDPESYHGVTPFDKCTGKFEKPAKGETYTQIFSEVVREQAKNDKRIVVVSAAMCGGTGMTDFADKYPKRFVDVGIAEQHAVTFAGGMAARGMRPVVGIYSTFLQRGYDEIEHDVCLPHVPVVFALDRAGLVGSDGKTHHGVFDIAYLRHLPNIQLFMPRDRTAMKKILKYALAQEGPCAIRYPRSEVPHDIVPGGLPPFGSENVTQWEILKEGSDVAILAIGHMVFYAYRAAQLLEEKGIHACVVDACAIKPLDSDTLQQLTRCYSIVTIEDHVISCGFGSAVAEAVTGQDTVARVLRIGIPDTFVEHGTLHELYTELGWQPEQLAERIAGWFHH